MNTLTVSPSPPVVVPKAVGGRTSLDDADMAAFNSVPLPLAVVSHDGEIVFANPSWSAAAERFGFSCRLGANYLRLCDDAGAAATAAGVRAVLAGTEASYASDGRRHNSGSAHWIRVTATPLPAPKGAGAVIMHLEISEQRLVEQALRESEERSRAIVDSALDGIITIDEHDRILEFNPAAERILGWRREQALGRELAELIVPPALREHHRRGLQRYHQSGIARLQGKRLELPALNASGGQVMIELTAVRLGSGDPPRFTAFVRDLTEQRRSEEKLRQNEALLKIAGRTARLGGWVVNLQGPWRVSWSEEMCSLLQSPFGYSLHDALRFTARRYRRPLLRALRGCARRGLAFDLELEVISSRGRALWTRIIGYAERDGNGRIVSLQGALQDISDSKFALLALRQSEQRFQLVASTTNDTVWDWNLLDDTLWWSEGAVNLLGWAHDSKPSLAAWTERIHNDDRDRMIAAVSAAVEGGGDGWHSEYRLFRPDGRMAHVSIRALIQRDATGRAVRMIGGMSDITERRQGELALARSNRALRMIGACNDALVRASSENELLQSVCGIAVRIGGYTAAWAGIRREHDGVLEPVAQEGEPLTLGCDIDEAHGYGSQPGAVGIDQHGDVTRIALQLHENGRRLGLASFCLREAASISSEEAELLRKLGDDISFGIGSLRARQEQQRLQLELRRDEARLREQASLLDKARDAILVLDVHYRIQYWNRSAERLYGWSAEEMLGQPLDRLLPIDGPDSVLQALRAVIDTGEWRGELAQPRRDGRRLRVESHWTLVRDEHERPRSILCINTDISERVAMEDRLRQSQRLEALGQLTGGVAHDFNNLLTVICGNSELLMEQLAERGEKRLGVLAELTRNAAEHGARLTNRLLSFASRQTLEPESVDAGELLRQMQALLRRTLREDIDLQLVIAPALWPALIDPTQLEAALLNLCLNARDAMHGHGQLVLSIDNQRIAAQSAEHLPDMAAGDYVRVSVSDTGCGIPPEHLQRVFEPFFTTKEFGKGTGLGLSMVYGFVRQSRGHIHIDSTLGSGTCVHMYLPRATTAPEAAATPAAMDLPGGDARILLVEDNGLVRRYAEDQLLQLGYRVFSAGNGVEALQLLREIADIDLLFTDVVMPGGLNGAELALAARQLRPGLRVLFTSGYVEGAVGEAALDPRTPLLRKPYPRSELAHKVRAALAAASPTGQPT